MKQLVNKLPQKQLSVFIDLIMIALGIIGIMGGLSYALYFPTNTLWVVGLLIVYSCFVYYTYQHHQHSYGMMFVFIGILIMILLTFSFELESFFHQFKNIIEHDYFLRFDELFKNTQTIHTIFPLAMISIVGLPIVHLIVSCVVVKKKTLFKLLMFMIIFLFPVMIRHSLESYTSYCFVIFLLYEYVTSVTLSYQKVQLSLKCSLLILLVFASVFAHTFLEPNDIFKQNSSTVLSNITNWIDGGVIDGLFGNGNVTGASSSISGSLPTNDIRLDNSDAVTVQSSVPFSTYLRGYSLAKYENNKWKPVTSSFENSKSTLFYTEYLRKQNESSIVQSVTVTSKKSLKYQLVPYYPLREEGLIADSYFPRSNEPMDIFVNRTENNHDFWNTMPSFDKNYTDYVKQEYMDVPSELKQKLLDLANEYLQTNISEYDYISRYMSRSNPMELATFVQNLLQEQAVYDLKSGPLPNDQDFVDYFLFQNKKGSCTHYASSGTLLLRSLGVPARYVSGFIMKESDFVNGVASIKNNRSHAWVEIFVDGRGWIPIEMTPAGGYVNSSDSVGTMLDNLTQYETTVPNQVNPNQSQTPTQNDPTTPTGTPQQVDEQPAWYENIMEYSQYIIIGIVIIILLIVYRLISVKWFFIKIKRYQYNQRMILYYQRMLRMKRFGGEIQEDIIDIAYKAKFSQHTINDDEIQKVSQYYLKFIKSNYQKLPFYKKILYKYIFGYI